MNWFSPLATVVFSNVRVVLAGVFNITAMNTHSMFELSEHKTKTDLSYPLRPLGCSVPQRQPRIPNKGPKGASRKQTNARTYGHSPTAAASRRRGSATP